MEMNEGGVDVADVVHYCGLFLTPLCLRATSRSLLVQVEDVPRQQEEEEEEQEEVLQPALAPAHASSGQKAAQIVLSSSAQKAAAAAAAGGAAWADGFMPRSRSEISESCRQAFAAACHLLLECTTFPVYLSEGETQALYSQMFLQPGELRPRSGTMEMSTRHWNRPMPFYDHKHTVHLFVSSLCIQGWWPERTLQRKQLQ